MSTSRFECLRVSFRQDKDGYLIVLRIHPNDVDAQITMDRLGQRYNAALQRVGEDEKPVEHKEKTTGERMVQQAAILCADTEFQKWLVREGFVLEANEQDAAKAMRDILGVESRADLKTSPEAQEVFRELLKRYGR